MSRVGWCPSVVTPMAAGDGMLVRVKPTASSISAEALRAIATAAEECGNGLFDLTNRANLQVRGLWPASVETFASIARMHGLASDGAAFEEIRNVAADPLGADDPGALFNSHAIARAIETMLGREQALLTLPAKFGVLVDCGNAMPIPDARADIVLRERMGALTVGLGGGTAALICTPDEAPDLVRRLALAFLELAGPADAPPFRMRELVERIGEAAVLATAGLDAATRLTVDTSSPGLTRESGCGSPGDARIAPRHDAQNDGQTDQIRAAHLAVMYAPAPVDSPVGYVPFSGCDTGAFAVGAPRGRIDAAALINLADLADDYADGTLRMTPWRGVAFVPVAADRAPALASAVTALGLITDPTDPRRALRGPDIEPASEETLARPEALTT